MNQKAHDAALPIAHTALRVLVILNWVYGAWIFLMLMIQTLQRPWLMKAFGMTPSADADRAMTGLTLVAVLGLIAIPLNYQILERLFEMVETVRTGNPFVRANADRLQIIAWALFGLQVLSIVIGWIGNFISTKQTPVHLDAGFSISGVLAVLLVFVLARVFAEGARMREDLDGVV